MTFCLINRTSRTVTVTNSFHVRDIVSDFTNWEPCSIGVAAAMVMDGFAIGKFGDREDQEPRIVVDYGLLTILRHGTIKRLLRHLMWA